MNQVNHLDFGPRLGFAWDVMGNGKTALRGGIGLYYTQDLGGTFVNLSKINPPYVQTTTISNTSFDSPGNGIPSLSASPFEVSGVDPHLKTPYTESWTLGIQRQLTSDSLLDVAYVGTHEIHELGALDLNQPIEGEYAQMGIIPNNLVTTANTPYLNRIRPYLGFESFSVAPNSYNWDGFQTNYNGLQSSFQWRMKHNSILNVNYTFAKALSNTAVNAAPQYTYNIPANYGLTALNRKHVLNANLVYSLPFFANARGVEGGILGGWQTSAIVSYGSGQPFSANTTGVDPGGVGLLGSTAKALPDQISNPNSNAPHSALKWFNTAAFTPVPAGQYRVGNASVNNIIGPGYATWDISLFKNVHLWEQGTLQLRAESFNAFNRTNFTTVANVLENSNFGQVTDTAQPRVLQLAGKITF